MAELLIAWTIIKAIAAAATVAAVLSLVVLAVGFGAAIVKGMKDRKEENNASPRH